MIDCLYVYIYYISNELLIYLLLFSSFNRHVCAAVEYHIAYVCINGLPRTIIFITEAS
jgi:hypothetical protein